MSTDISTTNLQINILSKKQYHDIEPSVGELYFVEDENIIMLSSVGEEPLNPTNGDRYYSTTNNKIFTYNNGWDNGIIPENDIIYISKSTGYSYVYDGTKMISSSGYMGVDETTITKNDNDELQVIGIANKNIDGESTTYTWVGTLAEYQEQNIANLHPEWVCYITDDGAISNDMSLSNIVNRLNRAWCWSNITEQVETQIYTIPNPEIGFKTYTSTELDVYGTVDNISDEKLISNSKEFVRASGGDKIFDGIPEDFKEEVLTVYDLLKAIKG